MMKKIAMLAVIVMFSMTAFAQVKVSQNGNITNYAEGSNINLTSKDSVDVYYEGVLINVPRGKRLTLSKNKAGDILIKGDNLKGVKVLGKTLTSETPTTYVVDLNKNTVVNIPVTQAVNKKNNDTDKRLESAGEETVVDVVAFDDVDAYVNEIVSEQAVQDVEGQLSPSAPTSI